MAEQKPKSVAPRSGFSVGCVDFLSDDYAVGQWRNVLMVAWRNKTTGAGAREVAERLQRLAEHHARGVFYLALILETASPPEPEAREVLARMLKTGGDTIIAGAVVFEGSGLRAAFVRGVATGLVMLARPQFPFEVCTLEQAAELFLRRGESRRAHVDKERLLLEAQAFREAVEHPPTSGVLTRRY